MPTLAGLYYQVFRGDPALPAVILLHGAGGSHLSWPVAVRRLAGGSVYALDLPGHGNSTGSGKRSIEAYASNVLEWMEMAGLARAVLVGHSMGSAIALTLALEHPRQVSGLALLGSAASLKVNPHLLEAAGNPESYPLAVKKVIQWSFNRAAPENLPALVERRLASLSQAVLHGDFLACDAFDVSARLGQVDCPTMVMCGEEDRMTPLSASQALAGGIPGALLQVIAGAGHMVMLEKPLEVAQALGEFIANLAG